MTVACERCGTKFRLDKSKIGAGGAKVRCSKCQHAFVVQPPSAALASPGALDGETAVYAIPVDLKRRQAPAPLPVPDDRTVVDRVPDLPPLPSAAASQDDLPVEDADLIEPAGARPPTQPLTRYVDPFGDAGASPAAPRGGAPIVQAEITATMQMHPERIRAAAMAAEPQESGSAVTAVDSLRSAARGRHTTGIKILTSAFGLALMAFGVLLYLGGGQLDTALTFLRDGRMRTGAAADAYLDVQTVAMRSVLYPIANGNEVLVVVGTVKNGGPEARAGIDAIAELRDTSGRIVASERAPVGQALDPDDLARLTDREALETTFRQKVAASGFSALKPGDTAPFTIVVFNPPSSLPDLGYRVRLERGQSPPPVAQQPADDVAEGDPGKDKRKGKLKGKGKKGKRKGKAHDGEAAPE